jgi:hypothetical protein
MPRKKSGTSAAIASYAAKILRSSEYPWLKAVAASALAQRRKAKEVPSPDQREASK